MMKNNILLKAIGFVALSLVAVKSHSFETDVDSKVNGADLTISKNGNDGGDLTVEGQLKIESVNTASSGVATSINISTSDNDNKLPTVGAVRMLEVPAFCASRETGQAISFSKNVVFDTDEEKFDTTNSYSNGTFTAPIAGIYQFTWTTFSNSDGRTGIYVGGVLYLQTNYSDAGGHSLSTLVELDVNETVHLAGVDGHLMKTYGEANHNMFCGYLVQLTSD